MDVKLTTDLSLEVARSKFEPLTRLLREVEELIPGIMFERVPPGKGRLQGEIHPASTIGIAQGRPVIRIADFLRGEERIEAIAHEFTHLLLVYRFGVRLVDRQMPRSRDREELLQYYLTMGRNWDYFLGQIINTVHHLILIEYLRDVSNIESRLHLRLLENNLRVLAKENDPDQESLFAKGLIAFEYEKLIGGLSRAIHPHPQSVAFERAYDAAGRHFEGFTFRSFPCPSSYEGEILGFLEDLGYEKERFTFFPAVTSPDERRNKRESVPAENVSVSGY
jgi:hypothetical protein